MSIIALLIYVIVFLLVLGALCAVVNAVPVSAPAAPYAGLIKSVLYLLIVLVCCAAFLSFVGLPHARLL